MPNNEAVQTLAVLLGIEAGEDRPPLKRAAATRLKEAMKSDDVDEFMAALDDYIDIRGMDDDGT